ncbi:hypothetical protein TURU_001115 [Turdus rufiventris]|nr:hypothetical protein TURU_001115 [Turdus rufiventris]
MGLFGHGDLDNSRVSDHDKPIREKLLAYAAVKALLRVVVYGDSDFDMAPQRRLAYEADFKLKAVNHEKEHGNRAAAREFNVNESMVYKLLWENWMVEGEHSYTNTGMLRRISYATVCQWILDAWRKVSTTTIIRGFAKADIIPGLTSNGIKSTETDDSDGEDTSYTGSGLLDATV